MEEIKRNGLTFRRSTRKFKKYDVFKGEKYLFSFGDSRYQHFHDRLGLWNDLDHGDDLRLKRYYQRHGPKVKGLNADYFSKLYLW